VRSRTAGEKGTAPIDCKPFLIPAETDPALGHNSHPSHPITGLIVLKHHWIFVFFIGGNHFRYLVMSATRGH
jgi:hypothetical protein